MRVDINERGVMTVQPDTAIEAYALFKWAKDNMVESDGGEHMETTYWLCSGLIINANLAAPVPAPKGE